MAKRLETLKGLRRRLPNDQLDASRYEYLSIDQAEPNPGSPDSDNSLFMSDANGDRKFVRAPELGGLSFTNDALPNYDDFVVDGTYALILNNDPNSHTGPDSVGYRLLTAAAFTPPTLQTVTEEGNTTDQGIEMTGGTLTLDASTGLIASANASFNGTTEKEVRIDGPTLFYSAPALNDNTLLTIGDQDSVGRREALFAFVAPTLRQVTDQSVSANDIGSTLAAGAISQQGIQAPFLILNNAPPTRGAGLAAERTALVHTGIADSVGSVELRDLAVNDSTSNQIGAGTIRLPATGTKTYSSGDTVRMLVFDSVGPANPVSKNKNVKYADFDYDDLLGNDETLHTVTGRTEPGYLQGETGNLAIFSGGIKFSNPPAGNSFSAVFRGTAGGDSALGVRTVTQLTLGDSTTDIIKTHGLIVRYGSLDVQTSTTLDQTTIDGTLDVNQQAAFTSVNVEDLTSGRVVIAGADGELEDDEDLTFSGSTLTVTNIDVTGLTTLDSTTIDAGANGEGVLITGLAETSTESTAVMYLPAGGLRQRTLAASAFDAPDLQAVTDVGDSTTAIITVGGMVAIDSADFKRKLQVRGPFVLPNLVGSNSLRVLVLQDDSVGYQDLTQEAISGETLHTATSQGRTTSNEVGVQAVYIYDKSGFADNNELANFNIVIDSDRNFYAQDKIFFNDLQGGADQRFLTPIDQADRNYIRFTDPDTFGYPGIFDFISDDSDKPEAVGNALIRAGGLILTDSATVGTNLTITGNLTVNGTTTYVNTETLNVNDKNIVIAYGEVTETNTADAGIKIADSVNPFASFLYDGAGSWVVDVNLTVDSDLTVSGATNLNGSFAGGQGVVISGVGELASETSALMLGADDSVGFRNLSSGAFTEIESLTWETVLSFGDSTGLNVPYISNGFRIDSDQLPDDPTNLRIMTLKSGNGTDDSVGVRTLGTAANLAQADITLQFATNQGSVTTNTITVDGLNIDNPANFDISPYDVLNPQNALFWGPGDSVGYRDLGNLAFLDSDGETLESITSKGNANNTVTAQDLSFPNLRLTNISAKTVTTGLFLDGDSVVSRQLDASAFDPQDLQGVTETGSARNFSGLGYTRDSTNVTVALGGGLILPTNAGTGAARGGTNLVEGATIKAALAGNADFYQMLILDTNTDSVRRGNINTILQSAADFNLQGVMDNGVAQNGDGLNRDSTTVSPVFAAEIFYPGISKVASPSDFLVVYDSASFSLQRRSLSSILDGISLHDVTTVGKTTNNSIGVKDYRILQQGATFADDNDLADYDIVIDSEQNAFFVNLNATGLATLDSTTVDGTLTVTDSATITGNLNVSGQTELGSGSPIRLNNTQISVTGNSLTLQAGSHFSVSRPRIFLGNNTNSSFGTNTSLGPDIQIYSGKGEIQLIAGDRPGQAGAVTVVNMDSASFNVNVPTTLDSTTIDGTLLIRADNPNKTPRVLLVDSAQASTLEAAGSGAKLTASGSLTLKGDDPDLNLDIDSDSIIADLIEVRYRIIGENNVIRNGARTTYSKSTKDFTVYGQETGSRLLLGANGTTANILVDSVQALVGQVDKFKLNTGVQLQDASNRNLVIYDSAGAVLWGNV